MNKVNDINKFTGKQNDIEKLHDEMVRNLIELEREKFNKKVEELEKFWGEKEKLLSVFANHSEIDEIELAIYSLKVYSETSDNEIFYEYSGTVKTLLHQLLEDTIPSVHSIF